jgi:hypothetical protein
MTATPVALVSITVNSSSSQLLSYLFNSPILIASGPSFTHNKPSSPTWSTSLLRRANGTFQSSLPLPLCFSGFSGNDAGIASTALDQHTFGT